MTPGAQADRAGPADIDPAVLDAAQIRAVFGNAQPGFTHIVLIALTGAMAWDFVPHGTVALWAAGIMAVGLMRLAMVRRFAAVAPPDAALPAWERVYLALVALNGVMWGSAATLLQAQGHYELEVAIAFVVGGMCAAATITLSPRYRAIPIAIVPALGILAGQFWFSDIPTSNEMALMLMVYLLVLLNVGRRMNAQVRESFALRFTNQALVASLSDALAQTRRALDEAQRSARAKTRFLASASHDLRQPVHALRLFVETLANRPLDPESAGLVARARDSLAGLRGLLDTLLDISRLDAGTVQPVPVPLALGPLLAQAADAFAGLADEKGLRLSLRPTEAWVLSDPTLLGRLLRNLIENALSYTSEGGVLIGARKRGACLVVEVWDTGIGIAPEHEQEIFQEFFSLRGRSSDRQGGLGLGLAIVKRLCGLLGHDLAFRSVPGRGSVFRVTLPACAPASAMPPPDRAHAIPAGARVLVVEDDRAVALATTALLEGWGLRTAHAETADGVGPALDRLGGAADLVIADYRLADDVTGDDVIDAVARRQSTPLAAIIVTGDTGPQRLRSLHGQAWPVLHKPVDPDELAKVTAALLAPR
jgi:signal transduction histidine kinase